MNNEKEMDLTEYLGRSIEGIVTSVVKSTLSNPRESIFLAKFAKAAKAATQRRKDAGDRGEPIPPFLIASITEQCNLHCKGCYARANHACGENLHKNCLKTEEWNRIFKEAAELGISFILLAGGEPMIRRDVLSAAGEIGDVVFPVFTNGTMLNDDAIALFHEKRNLVPMVSLEGSEKYTDDRRGSGIYRRIAEGMESLKKKGILFGASVTVNKQNSEEVTSAAFLDHIISLGCRIVIYVEYVDMAENSAELAFDDEDRQSFDRRLCELRKKYEKVLFLSFPGDEAATGGCLAAGRGFFHINALGGAEPCPFSPYSDYNIKNGTLREAMQSELFCRLRDGGLLLSEHRGGCTLYEQKEAVEELIRTKE